MNLLQKIEQGQIEKLMQGKKIPNFMDRYGCIDKLMIAAQRNKFIKSGYKDELS
jgi:hypothetical protein